MIDDLPRKAVVELQPVTFCTMLRIGNGQHIPPLGIHLVAAGTRQGLTGDFFNALGGEMDLVVQFDGGSITEISLVTQLDPHGLLLILPLHVH